jgi:predicted RNA-binding Zn-ribbon protein involved in translation (DUF1610 family)
VDLEGILQYINKPSSLALVVVIGLLGLQHWNAIQLNNIPFSLAGFTLVDILYVYLVLNGVAAATIIYGERRTATAVQRLCPRCGKPLEIHPHFKCPKCGDISFDKK